jgi:hypothetical protein
MAVSGIKGTGIGQVTLPEFGGPMALQAGLRAAEPEYVEDVTGGVQDYTGGLTGAGLGLIDILGDFLGKSTDERLRAGTSTQPITTDSFQAGSTTREQVDPSQEPIIYQDEIMRIAESLKKTMPEKTTGSFQAGDTTRDQVDPTQSGQQNIGLSDDEEAAMAGADAAGAATEDATSEIIRTSVQDYLNMTGKETGAKTTEEYIKEFADATGLDVSGKPDKSTALMTFGLALMQNKAGKNFDVGKMLGSVGEAGEKALPAFEKAKSEARALRAKAGEYALGRTREDQAKAQQRENFYIIPKGKLGGPLGVVDAITKGKGEFTRLNAFELNDLDTNEEFNRNFEIVKASDYTDLAKEALKPPEAKDKYLGSSTDVPLYSGSKLNLKVQLPDRNVSSDTQAVLLTPVSAAINQINAMEKGMIRGEQTFAKLTGLLQETDISVPAQARSAVVQTLRNFGLDAGGETDPVKQIKVMLTKLKAKNAAEILGESGKTLSDNDRRMVSEIVGDISFTEGDEALLLEKLGSLYEDIIGTRRNEINEAYRNLESYGVNFNRGNSGQTGTGFTLGDDGIYRRAKQK